MPNVELTLMFVSPGPAAAASDAAKAAGLLPTVATVAVSAVPFGSNVSLAPVDRGAVLFVVIMESPALTGRVSVSCPAGIGTSSGFVPVLIAGDWLDTSWLARCAGVSRATRSAARSANE